MDWKQFLKWEEATRDTIDFKKIYVDMADDLIAGLLLSQIVYWYLPSKANKRTKLRVEKEGVLWLAKGRDDWFNECRIKPRQFDTAIKKLIDQGLVEKKTFKFAGNPTIHIRIIMEQFLSRFQEMINTVTYGENQDKSDEVDNPETIELYGFNESVKTKSQNGEMVLSDFVKTLTENTTQNKTNASMYGVADAPQNLSFHGNNFINKEIASSLETASISQEEKEIMDAIYSGCEKVDAVGFFDEFYMMLTKNFSKQLTPEVIKIAFDLYIIKQVDLYGKTITIKNETGWLYDCYQDAIKQYKALRYIADKEEQEKRLNELRSPGNYHFSAREKKAHS